MDTPYTPEKITLAVRRSNAPITPPAIIGSVRSSAIKGHTGSDLRVENEVLIRQRANVTNIVKRLMLCRDPGREGTARYICPGCGFEHRVPFSCKTRFCAPSGKVHVVKLGPQYPKKDTPYAPHLPITLTIPDSLRPLS